MRNDQWKYDPPLVKVAPKIPASPAKDYFGPSISKVPVVLEVDDKDFAPAACSDGSANILANIPDGDLFLPKGGQAVVDCGFSITLPAGFRCVVSGYIPGLMLDLIECKKFKVTVINLGEETTLKDREIIGKVRVEPIYLFEWIMRR